LAGEYFHHCGAREGWLGGFGGERVREGFGYVGACGRCGAEKRGGLFIIARVPAGERFAVGRFVEAEDDFDERDEAIAKGSAVVFFVFLCFQRFL
jgi:hypothetical protein